MVSTTTIVLLILGLLLVILYLYKAKTIEGFGTKDGPVPSASQSSMIPSDTPGATTGDPTKSKPQAKDVQATLETLKNLKLLAAALDPSRTNLPSDQKASIKKLLDSAPDYENKLQAALVNSNASPYSVDDVTKIRTDLEKAIQQLRQATEETKGRSPKDTTPTIKDPLAKDPTVQTASTNAISLEKLQLLVKRIQAESLRLKNLRSTEATVLTRIDRLDDLAADLNDIISNVERKKMKLSDVPLKESDADAFLSSLDDKSETLPPLLTPKGSSETQTATTPPNPSMANVQALLENAKYLKWGVDINIAYDPEVKQREKALQLLDSIEKNLTKHAVSETPLSAHQLKHYMNQLNALQFLSSRSTEQKPVPIDGLPTHSTRLGGEAEFPTAEQVDRVQGDGFGPSSYDSYGVDNDGSNLFPKPGDSSADTKRRPGYTMNTEAIEHRGSASAFDPAAVGGPDYKKWSLDLCKQIQGAQLGEPTNFGCIGNPEEVSSSYSWKGNYEMVCNRLGDTWGGWYPEMFGCPKPNPSAKFKASS